MARPLFRIEQLYKAFRVGAHLQPVLMRLTCELKPNILSAICGPSGSGKSTLLSILSGLEQADAGQVYFNDQNLVSLKPKELAAYRNQACGFVFQSPFFLPYLSVLDNVLLPFRYREGPLDHEHCKAVGVDLLEQVNLGHFKDKAPALLSGGELQRMAFVRAIVHEPSVIFADEPTASLDKKNAEIIMQLLTQQVEKGRSVVMVTHDPQAVAWAHEKFNLVEGSQLVEFR